MKVFNFSLKHIKKEKTFIFQHFLFYFYGGTSQNRTEDESFADFCLTTWLRCHINIIYALKV